MRRTHKPEEVTLKIGDVEIQGSDKAFLSIEALDPAERFIAHLQHRENARAKRLGISPARFVRDIQGVRARVLGYSILTHRIVGTKIRKMANNKTADLGDSKTWGDV